MKMRNRLSLYFIILLLLVPLGLSVKSIEANQFYFKLDAIIPKSRVLRVTVADIIADELVEIGIEVENHLLGWSDFIKRSWGFPCGEDYDYIPEYEKGGYDILFMGGWWPLDLRLRGLYESSVITPLGDNYYQYENKEYDDILNKYNVAQNPTARMNYAHQLQSYIYNDLPAISLFYNHTLMAIRDEVSGIDSVLLYHGLHRTENWMNSEDQIIKYGIPYSFNYYNVYKSYLRYPDILWMQSVYGSLFKKDPLTHHWIPMIASSYSISSDKYSVTVHIDPNAKFSDGSQVLAEDVKYSYELYMDPILDNPRYSDLLYWLGDNSSIEIIDSDTLKFTFEHIHNFPLNILSCAIIDKSIVEPAIINFGYSIFDEEPFTGNVQDVLVRSCGPFKLNSFYWGESNLAPNPYWNNLTSSGGVNAQLNELSFVTSYDISNALDDLKSNVIDVLSWTYSNLIIESGLTFDDIDELFNISGIRVRINNHEEISLNQKHPIIGTGELTPNGTTEAAKWVRKAISHCIPRDDIITNLLVGLGSPGITPVPETCVGFDDSLLPYEYNLTLAKSFMEKAGYGIEISPTDTSKNSFNGFYLLIISFMSLSYLLLLKKNKK